MSKLKESREFALKDKVVLLKDLRVLANLICSEASQNSNTGNLNFRVKTSENSSFQSFDPEIFSEDSEVSRHRVESVELSYHESGSQNSILIHLNHGDIKQLNYIRVSGTDTKWVRGTISQIQTIIDSFKPQNNLPRKLIDKFNFLLFIAIGTVLWWIAGLAFNNPENPLSANLNRASQDLYEYLHKAPAIYYLSKYSLLYFLGLIFGHQIISKIYSFWPSIEIQIGPEHTLIEKRRRSFFAGVIVLCVVPLALSFFYDFIKN